MSKNVAASRARASRSSSNPNRNPSKGDPSGTKNSVSSPSVEKTTRMSKQLNTQKILTELSNGGSEETDISTSEEDDSNWISWFCGLRGNELLCEVDEDYIQDDFNLCGLQGQVPLYDYALDLILDNDSLSGDMDGEDHSEIESSAELLYGFIHARYILTSKGLNAMHQKYKQADFGHCPRVFCGGQSCLPVGISDSPNHALVRIYCPKCEELYSPRCKYQSNMDGACIGATFPHLYLMTYPLITPAKPVENFVPRVFGFKLHRVGRK